MQTNLLTLSSQTSSGSPITNLETLVEQIWHDLNGQLPRTQIYQVAAESVLTFAEATVTTFIPIFIHRDAVEKLRTEATPPRVEPEAYGS